MMKLKKGFAVAMAAGVLTTGGLGVQATVFSATAFAQLGGDPSAQGEDETDSANLIADENLANLQSEADLGTMPDTVKLTIHKFGDNGTGDAINKNNRGLKLKDTTVAKFGDKVEAKFEVQKITEIDLKTNDGWRKAVELQKSFDKTDNQTAKDSITNHAIPSANPAANYTLGAAVTMTTTGGSAEHDFDAGLYLVTEVSATAPYKATVKPFVVALPMTNPQNHTKWLKEVHVYPKNDKQDVEKPTKTVKDGSNNGFIAVDTAKKNEQGYSEDKSKANYTISQKLVDGEKYNKFILADYYPTDRLEKPTDTGLVVKIEKENETPVTLTLTDDYTVSEPAVADVPSTTNVDESTALKSYVIKLTGKGLEKVNEKKDKGGWAVTANFNLVVKQTAEGQTALEPVVNQFKTIIGRDGQNPPTPPANGDPDPNDPNTPPTPPVPGDPQFPKSYYGNVNIKKVGIGETTALENAKFDLYVCKMVEKTPGQSDTAELTLLGDAIKTGITPDANDTTMEIRGLLVNDYRDGAVVTEADRDSYCLKETKAPAGHELLAEPIKFQILRNNADTVEFKNLTVKDPKENGGFDLPLTGGKGVFALLLAGAAFLVLGRGYSVYAGRRKDA